MPGAALVDFAPLGDQEKTGLSQLRVGCLLRPWLPRRQRRAPFLVQTWSRLGVGDRLRGSHLDQDQVSLSSQRVFEKSLMSEQGG